MSPVFPSVPQEQHGRLGERRVVAGGREHAQVTGSAVAAHEDRGGSTFQSNGRIVAGQQSNPAFSFETHGLLVRRVAELDDIVVARMGLPDANAILRFSVVHFDDAGVAAAAEHERHRLCHRRLNRTALGRDAAQLHDVRAGRILDAQSPIRCDGGGRRRLSGRQDPRFGDDTNVDSLLVLTVLEENVSGLAAAACRDVGAVAVELNPRLLTSSVLHDKLVRNVHRALLNGVRIGTEGDRDAHGADTGAGGHGRRGAVEHAGDVTEPRSAEANRPVHQEEGVR